jgi:hypothetical protein
MFVRVESLYRQGNREHRNGGRRDLKPDLARKQALVSGSYPCRKTEKRLSDLILFIPNPPAFCNCQTLIERRRLSS